MTKDSLSSHSDHSDQSPKNNASSHPENSPQISTQTNSIGKTAAQIMAATASALHQVANSASVSESSSSSTTSTSAVAANKSAPSSSNTMLRDDPSPSPTPPAPLPKPKPFADQFYEAVNDVLGGTNDQQFLMLTMPGQILDPYTYQWDYQQGVKPTRVSMQEFLLSEKLFDPCTMTGADNGFTLAHQYRSALDNLTPRLDAKLAEDKNELRLFLLTKYPDRFDAYGNQLNVAQVYTSLMDAYVAEQHKFAIELDNVKKNLHSTYHKDQDYENAYLDWYFTNADSYLNVINAKYSAILQVFTPNDMSILEGILDSGTGAELEQARRVLNNFGKTSPNGSTIYPVQFVPDNWFELLTEGQKIEDALESVEALSTRLSLLETRRNSLNAQLLTLSSYLPDKTEVQTAIDNAKQAQTALDSARNDLMAGYGSGAGRVIDAVASLAQSQLFGPKSPQLDEEIARQCQYNNIDPNSTGTGKTTTFIDTIKALISADDGIIQKQTALVNSAAELSKALADASSKQNISSLSTAINSLQGQIDGLDQEIQTLRVKIDQAVLARSQSIASGDKDALASTDTLPDGFTQIVIESAASAMTTQSKMVNSATAHSYGSHFFFCGLSSSSSQADSSFQSFSASTESKVQIALNVAKVSFIREWFNPGVFALTKDMYRFSKSRISPNKVVTHDAAGFKEMQDCIFPCYPVAMVIARDITIRVLNSSSISSDFAHSCEQHSAVGGGFLFFGGSSSSSHTDSQSNSKAVSDSKSVTIHFNAPQIIGYYLEQVRPDLSTPITGASDPENTNIKDFVKAYKNMLAAMNDQHQIQQQVRDLQQKHSLHMPDATSPTE